MAAAWQNCLVNSSDVKELTPEFFYLPNFLVNADGFQLGQRQVRLPLCLAASILFLCLGCRVCIAARLQSQ